MKFEFTRNQRAADEATDLARRFWDMTPYTAYLIVEDEDRRRVPMTERSMQKHERG